MNSAGVIRSKCPPWLWSKIATCSVDAIKVLAALDARDAYSPARAVTDEKLAAMTGFAERDIIDLTGALLAAGLLIVASTKKPYGRYVVLPADAEGMKAARAYQESLRARAAAIHGREGATGKAIALYDQHARPADSTGQLALAIPVPEAQWRDN